QQFAGGPVVNAPPWPTQPGAAWDYGPAIEYAGFWMRFAAAIIDGLVVGFAGGMVAGVIFAAVGSGGRNSDADGAAVILAQLLMQGIGWLYFAILESSATQATLGKMALGLKVTDTEGQRIGFGK